MLSVDEDRRCAIHTQLETFELVRHRLFQQRLGQEQQMECQLSDSMFGSAIPFPARHRGRVWLHNCNDEGWSWLRFRNHRGRTTETTRQLMATAQQQTRGVLSVPWRLPRPGTAIANPQLGLFVGANLLQQEFSTWNRQDFLVGLLAVLRCVSNHGDICRGPYQA